VLKLGNSKSGGLERVHNLSVVARLLLNRGFNFVDPSNREPISIDLHIAEQAFRDLHYRLGSEIALMEKAKE
jgi:hypothetical protein